MDVKRYVGQEMYLGDLPEVVQRACRGSIQGTITFYGPDLVDVQIMHDQVRLCEATADYVYSEYTPLEMRYERGSRPELEKVLDRILADASDERDRVLRILRFVRDLHEFGPRADEKGLDDLFHGGIEEEVIKKGSNMCNEQSRVFCVLCQMAGIPARYVGHYVGGHGVMEACVEGKWGYFDNRGKYFLKPDGAFASTWELVRDPSLIDAQPAEVTADLRKGCDMDGTRRYFSPVEVTVVTNYFVWERERYNYDWIWNTSEFRRRLKDNPRDFPEELSKENVLAMVRGEKEWPS